jgi:nicotinate-nucleotide adenylyltransferase
LADVNTRPVVLLMGGSFDPVHQGHVAVADYFSRLLAPDSLRLLPAGDPWQKPPLKTSAADRVAMLRLAFEGLPVPVVIDEQEIRRGGGSYTIDTLRSLRAELGNEASLAWIIGADQLAHFNTWREWRALFDLAHFCVAARPGYAMDRAQLPPEVATAFSQRMGTAAQMRDCAHGLALFASNLSFDMSSTEVRAALARGELPTRSLPPTVLDYIKQHHIYRI